MYVYSTSQLYIWPQAIIVHNYTPTDRTFIDCIVSVRTTNTHSGILSNIDSQ